MVAESGGPAGELAEAGARESSSSVERMRCGWQPSTAMEESEEDRMVMERRVMGNYEAQKDRREDTGWADGVRWAPPAAWRRKRFGFVRAPTRDWAAWHAIFATV